MGSGWTTKAPMVNARTSLASGVVNGILYVVGGTAGGEVRHNEAYDPVTNTWTTKALMPTARQLLGAAAAGGILYVIGGFDSPNFYAVNEAYDPLTNTWTTKAPMPTGRDGLVVATLAGSLGVGEFVHAVGGYDGVGTLNKNEAYDPVTNTWAAKANMSQAKVAKPGAVVSGILHVLDAQLVAVPHQAYNPATNAWVTNKAAPPGPSRAYMTAAVADGTIYLIGGEQGAAPNDADLDVNHAYKASTNTWTVKSPIPGVRSRAAAGAINGIIYVVGGTGIDESLNIRLELARNQAYDYTQDIGGWQVGSVAV